MSFKIIVRDGAKGDITDAAKWYEEKRQGLGKEFLISLDVSFHIIQANPKLFRVKYKGMRMALTRRFPYAVFFMLNKDSINVLAVLHQKRATRKILRKR